VSNRWKIVSISGIEELVMKTDTEHLFGVEFYLEHENSSRYCEIIAKHPEEIFGILNNLYEDLKEITEIEDQGECDEDGEMINEEQTSI